MELARRVRDETRLDGSGEGGGGDRRRGISMALSFIAFRGGERISNDARLL